MKWGIFDTRDGLWIGAEGDDGPKVFDSEDIINGKPLGETAKSVARIAARIAEIRAGLPIGRLQARELNCPNPRQRDELPLTDTTLNVLRKIESGGII